MIKRFDYTPVLGWSASRYDKFTTCKRQYYYEYYGKYDQEFTPRKIYKLKDLTSVPMEVGCIVHHVIKVLLNRLKKTHKAIDQDRFFDYARHTAADFCKRKAFCEVHYGQKEAIDPAAVLESVNQALRNFLESERYTWIIEEAVPGIGDWIIEPPGYGEARINDLKVYCKVDFLFPVNDKIFIIDWKTGKPHEKKHKLQLQGYTSWASYHFEKDPMEIVPVIAYLKPEYRETITSFNEFDIEDFAIQVDEQTQEMHRFCENIEENIPREKSEFKQTTIRKICNYCNYRELCFPEEQGKAGAESKVASPVKPVNDMVKPE